MIKNKNKQHGVTLIELMIVVAIVAILAAVAIPAYQTQGERARRADGTSELTRIMDLQERFFANRFPPTYTDDLNMLGLGMASGVPTPEGHYLITADACPGAALTQCVRLTAAAEPSQVNDGDLVLDSRGTRTRGGMNGWGN